MTTVSPKKNHHPARVNEIGEKLMEIPELASLINQRLTPADDASDLVKGLLQASINAGLKTEIDAHSVIAIATARPKPRGKPHRAAITATGRTPKPSTLATARLKELCPGIVPARLLPGWCPRVHVGSQNSTT